MIISSEDSIPNSNSIGGSNSKIFPILLIMQILIIGIIEETNKGKYENELIPAYRTNSHMFQLIDISSESKISQNGNQLLCCIRTGYLSFWYVNKYWS
jgi:hypothetical protein